MKIPAETICSIEKCKKIFCCESCRKKHEQRTHAVIIKSQGVDGGDTSSRGAGETNDLLYVVCPICSNQPFLLGNKIYPEEVLEHIRRNHLPLRCRKCAKVYTQIEELHDFSKCVKSSSKPEILIVDINACISTLQKTTVNNCEPIKFNTISTQTSPIQKAREISFSSTKGKLVRTTSTPVHSETESSKPKEQTFNASGAQVSSIYNSGCETEIEKNSPIERPGSLQTLPTDSVPMVYRKFGGRQKVATITPLRQIMSKSIQKAFAEHGFPLTSEEKKHEFNETYTVLTNLPLDLRLSPALRRSQSDTDSGVKFYDTYSKIVTTESTSKPQQYLSSARRTATNSIVITHVQEQHNLELMNEASNSGSTVSSSSNGSVYKTCHSVEIITSTELSEFEVQKNVFGPAEANDELHPLKNIQLKKSPRQLAAINTPITRLSGGNFTKKLIKFETPNVKNNSICEKFYTPTGSSPVKGTNASKRFVSKSITERELTKFSPMCIPSLNECAQSTAYSHYEIDYDSNDDVFYTPTTDRSKNVETSDQSTQHGNGFIWSFMSSVMQKGTRFLDNKGLSFAADGKVGNSIIKRCSSIAGSLVRSNTLLDEKQLQSMKRKRTNTFDSQTSPLSTVQRMDSLPQHLDNLSSSKRFRIQGRKPIERMRNTSL